MSESSVESDEDECVLPEDTLQLLQQFLSEKAQQEDREREQAADFICKELQFEENWQLSQFWYNEDTKTSLGNVIKNLKLRTVDKIALLSCPSLYHTIKNLHKHVKLFEYDRRFMVFDSDFVYYDFNKADQRGFLRHHHGLYKVVIADPPFLSEDCISKVSSIIKKLLQPDGLIIFCSGDVVEPWLSSCLVLNKCDFRPEHQRNLGNQFATFANFKLDKYL